MNLKKNISISFYFYVFPVNMQFFSFQYMISRLLGEKTGLPTVLEFFLTELVPYSQKHMFNKVAGYIIEYLRRS